MNLPCSRRLRCFISCIKALRIHVLCYHRAEMTWTGRFILGKHENTKQRSLVCVKFSLCENWQDPLWLATVNCNRQLMSRFHGECRTKAESSGFIRTAQEFGLTTVSTKFLASNERNNARTCIDWCACRNFMKIWPFWRNLSIKPLQSANGKVSILKLSSVSL